MSNQIQIERIKEDIKNSLDELIGISPDKAILVVTGMFVGLVVAYAEANGSAEGGEITIDGGDGNRDITIHAEK